MKSSKLKLNCQSQSNLNTTQAKSVLSPMNPKVAKSTTHKIADKEEYNKKTILSEHNKMKDQNNFLNKSMNRSKSQHTPKDNMKEVLNEVSKILYTTSNLNTKDMNLKRNKSMKSLNNNEMEPKYNQININDIKNKMTKQSFNLNRIKDSSLFLGTTEQSVNSERKSFANLNRNASTKKLNNAKVESEVLKNTITIPSKEVQKLKSQFFENLDHKERKLKSIYPNLSIEEIKKLAKRDTQDKQIVNEEADNKNKKLNELNSNIFNAPEKKFTIKTPLNKPSKKDTKTPTPKLINIDSLKKNKSIKKIKEDKMKLQDSKNYDPKKQSRNRPKSARERKEEEFTSNVIIGDAATLDKRVFQQGKIIRARSKYEKKHLSFDEEKENAQNLINTNVDSNRKTSLMNNLSAFQGKNFIEKAYNRIEQNNTVERHFIINSSNELSEKEIKQKLANKGIHLSKIDFKWNITTNNGVNSCKISLRTNPEEDAAKILKSNLKLKDVQETFIEDKPFLKKPKSDLIPSGMSILDTKLNQKLMKREVESTTNKEEKVFQFDKADR